MSTSCDLIVFTSSSRQQSTTTMTMTTANNCLRWCYLSNWNSIEITSSECFFRKFRIVYLFFYWMVELSHFGTKSSRMHCFANVYRIKSFPIEKPFWHLQLVEWFHHFHETKSQRCVSLCVSAFCWEYPA